MNTDFIKGVIVPILTPINENEFIDEAKLRDQVNYVIDGGVLGILAFGSNGEFYVIDEDEMERGLKIMIDQAGGRVPVYFGIGAISTKKCCRLAKMAAACGTAGISVLQPMFLNRQRRSCSSTLRPLQRPCRRHLCCFTITRAVLTIPCPPGWWSALPTRFPISWE